MKVILLISLIVFSTTEVLGQINMYNKPAEQRFIDTHVPLDFNLLNVASEIAESERRTSDLISQAVTLYNTYPKYPSSLENGWHEVVCITNGKIYQHEAYVINNEVVTVKLNNETIELKRSIPIVNGRCLEPKLSLYFFEDLYQYNK